MDVGGWGIVLTLDHVGIVLNVNQWIRFLQETRTMDRRMKKDYVLGLKESVEFWKEMNPEKIIHLLDLTKLISIMRRYFVMYPKKETLITRRSSK